MNIFKHKAILAAIVASLLTAVVASQAQVPGVNSTLNAVFNLVYDNSTMKPTYSATASFTPVASATDVCSVSGSATKTVKVRKAVVSFAGSTAAVTEAIAAIKRSTAYTVGVGGTMGQVPYDSTNSLTSSTTNAGTVALAEYWTGNPTVGTVVGTLSDVMFGIGTSIGSGHVLTFDWGVLGSPVVLRGAAQNLAVNFNGVTISGNIACTFEWTED